MKLKGFIQWVDDTETSFYWTNGTDVYRSLVGNQQDSQGYTMGRWECHVNTWNRYAEKLGRVLVTNHPRSA